MRAIPTDLLTEILSDSFSPTFLLELVFTSLTLNLTTSPFDLSWDSKTWIGNGWFHSHVGPIESKSLDTNGLEINLSGVPQDLVSTILLNNFQNTACKLYLTALDSDKAVIDPFLVFLGRLDVPSIDHGANTSLITLKFESEAMDMERPRELRFDRETQKLFYPDDFGFSVLPRSGEWDGSWGQTKKQLRQAEARKARRHNKDGSRRKKK